MPRDSSGQMTLTSGNPVVSGTTIDSSWANTTVADLAAEIEDSLSRSGKGGMLVPFNNSDGTVTAPGITFTNGTGTGFYRSAAGLGVAVAGALKMLFASTLATVKTALKVEGGLEVVGNVTTADGAIPRMSVAAINSVTSTTSTGAFEVDTAGIVGTWQDVTNATVTITSNGRPLVITLIPDNNGASYSYVGVEHADSTSITSAAARFQWLRSGTSAGNIGMAQLVAGGASSATLASHVPPGALMAVDTPAAGTYTYHLQIQVPSTYTTGAVHYCKVMVYEL